MSSDNGLRYNRKGKSEMDQSKISDIVNNLKEFELSASLPYCPFEEITSAQSNISTDVLQAAEQLLSLTGLHEKDLQVVSGPNTGCKNFFPTPPASVEFAPYSPDGFKCSVAPQNGDAEAPGETLCRQATLDPQLFASPPFSRPVDSITERCGNISDADVPPVDITFSEIRRVLGDDPFSSFLSSNSGDVSDSQKSKEELAACANTLASFATECNHNNSVGVGSGSDTFGGCTPDHLNSFMDVLLTDAVPVGQNSSCEDYSDADRKLKRLEFDLDPIPTDISTLSGSPSKAFSSVMSIMPNFSLTLFDSPPPAYSKLLQRPVDLRQKSPPLKLPGGKLKRRERRHSSHSSPKSTVKKKPVGRSRSAMELSSPSSDWRCDYGGNLPNRVSVMGFQLPRVIPSGPKLGDISHRDAAAAHFVSYVCTTDVFQTFFSSRHWDEFKNILVSNNIKPLQIPTVSEESGHPEVLECITVEQIEFLLMNNQARRDGFAKCLKMSLSESNITADSRDSEMCGGRITSQTVINVNEKMPGLLESGIRTRRGDQSDLVYVVVEGKTLPSMNIGGQQMVRLVDIYCQLLHPSTQISHSQLQAVKKTCNALDIVVHKCTQNEKARMVVYANSVRHNSLHIITLEDMGILVKNQILRAQKKSHSGSATKKRISPQKRKTSRDGRSIGKRLKFGAGDSGSEYDGSETDSASVCSRGSSGAKSDSSVVIEEVITRNCAPQKKKSMFYCDSKSNSRVSTPSKLNSDRRSQSIDRTEQKPNRTCQLNVETADQTASTPTTLTPRSESSVSSRTSSNTNCPLSAAAIVVKMDRIKSRIDRGTLKFASMPAGPPRRNLQNKLVRLKGKLEKYMEIYKAQRDDGYKGALIPQMEKLESSGNSMLLRIPVPQCYVYVQNEKDLKLGATFECGSVGDDMPQCSVEVESTPPIAVTVKDMNPTAVSAAAIRQTGCPVGHLYADFCVNRNSPCILCTGCSPSQFFSVVDFVVHNHGRLRPSECMRNPRLLLVVDNLEETKFQIWKTVCTRWKSWRLPFAPNPPDDMAEHYRDHYYNGPFRKNRSFHDDLGVYGQFDHSVASVVGSSHGDKQSRSRVASPHENGVVMQNHCQAGENKGLQLKRKWMPSDLMECKSSKRTGSVSERINYARFSLDTVMNRHYSDPVRPSLFSPYAKAEKEKLFERWFPPA